jgi:hypothetical protein
MTEETPPKAHKNLARLEWASRSQKSIHLQLQPRVAIPRSLGTNSAHERDRAAAGRAHSGRGKPTSQMPPNTSASGGAAMMVPGSRGPIDHSATMMLNLVVSPQAPNATITLAYTVPERGARIARRHPHHKSGASETRREADEAGATATILTITSGTTQENISVECAIEPHLLLLTPGAH